MQGFALYAHRISEYAIDYEVCLVCLLHAILLVHRELWKLWERRNSDEDSTLDCDVVHRRVHERFAPFSTVVRVELRGNNN